MDENARYGLSNEDWRTIRDRFPEKDGDELVGVALTELARRFYADEMHKLSGSVTFYSAEELERIASSDEPELATAE